MNDMMQELVASLRSSGTLTEPEAEGQGLLVTEVDGEPVTPGVHVRVTEDDLQDFVRRNANTCASTFPDVTPEVAAYRILLINLDEALSSGGTDIVVADGRVRWTAPPPWSWLNVTDADALAGADPADLRWSAHPPDAAR